MQHNLLLKGTLILYHCAKVRMLRTLHSGTFDRLAPAMGTSHRADRALRRPHSNTLTNNTVRTSTPTARQGGYAPTMLRNTNTRAVC